MDIYILRNGIKLGPYTEIKTRDLLSSGLVTDQDLGWHDGLSDWVPLNRMSVVPTEISQHRPPQMIVGKGGFRLVVILSFLCIVAQIVCAYAQTLPESLATFVNDPGNSGSIAGGICSATFFTALVVSYAGLLLLKAWGRTVFAVTVSFGLIMSLTQGPLVEPSSAGMFGSLIDLLTGAVLALAFLTPLFENQTEKN